MAHTPELYFPVDPASMGSFVNDARDQDISQNCAMLQLPLRDARVVRLIGCASAARLKMLCRHAKLYCSAARGS